MTAAALTVITATDPARVCKLYALDAGGKLTKQAVAHVTEGAAQTVSVPDAAALMGLLRTTTERDNEVICTGIFRDAGDEPFRMVSEKRLAAMTRTEIGEAPGGVQTINGERIAARLKRGIEAPQWLLFDADNPPGMPDAWRALSLAERLAMLETIIPGISTCERVELRGSSSRVMNGSRAPGPHTHAWVRVDDPTRIEVLRHAAGVSAVNAGLAFRSPRYSRTEPGRVIGHSWRSLIDFSVWDAGRLVFTSRPDVKADGYAVADAGLRIVNPGGGALSLAGVELPDDGALADYQAATGARLDVKREGDRVTVRSTGELTLDTEIERRGVVKPLRDWAAGMKPGAKMRCETPFRASVSEAAVLRIGLNGRPILHDVGSGVTYHMAEEPGAWPQPNMAILSRSAATVPALPIEVFGDFWNPWITRTAEGSNAPIDYVAMPVLAIGSALLGNARWVVAWRGWFEPPALWCCSVGNPSSGKSSGAAPVTRDALRKVEAHIGKDYPAELERWETVASIARAANKGWEKAVAHALKVGEAVPEKPPEATVSPKPIRPRASVTDATVEALAPLLAGVPKGVLHLRDELAGWLLNMSRYSNGGSDRPFWLEAYTGGPYQVDRQKYPVPIFVPHLTIPVFGTIQPDRLGETLADADDGLASRFLWAWPDAARAFSMPRDAGDPFQAATALQRLADLRMAKDDSGDDRPVYLHLDPDGQQVLVDFAQDMQAREPTAHGLLKSSIGKARGQALRLALVLEYLWWAGGDGPEPTTVSGHAMRAATGLMDGYFLPMAARVLGDASIPESERNARTLATWIMETRPGAVNVSAIRDSARLPGLRESETVKAATQFLADAGWLAKAPLTGSGGRPRGDWLVNPRLFDGAA